MTPHKDVVMRKLSNISAQFREFDLKIGKIKHFDLIVITV
jgi:hypothetical protein